MKVIGWSKKWIFASIIGVRKTINLVFDQKIWFLVLSDTGNRFLHMREVFPEIYSFLAL